MATAKKLNKSFRNLARNLRWSPVKNTREIGSVELLGEVKEKARSQNQIDGEVGSGGITIDEEGGQRSSR